MWCLVGVFEGPQPPASFPQTIWICGIGPCSSSRRCGSLCLLAKPVGVQRWHRGSLEISSSDIRDWAVAVFLGLMLLGNPIVEGVCLGIGRADRRRTRFGT